MSITPSASVPLESSGELHTAAVRLPGTLVIVPIRGGDGLGVSVKVANSGRTFRIEPARDPRAPRFWCLRVYLCAEVRGDGHTDEIWWGAGGMARADLPAAIDAIRADPTAWLANEARSDLRGWMLGTDASSV
jgi:hypothetical protein